jgi:hypothetical protein
LRDVTATLRQRLATVGAPAASGAPPTYFWQSLLCFFLFLPTAVVALVFSFQVSRRVQTGDHAGAIRASRLARIWCFVSLVVFTVVNIILLATTNLA